MESVSFFNETRVVQRTPYLQLEPDTGLSALRDITSVSAGGSVTETARIQERW